jgi:hypothetical protein
MQRRFYSWEDALPICLYCKESDVQFNTVEHVIPESLGNQAFGSTPPLLLPKGVVCDKCNHEKLSFLDAALIEFPPISQTRMLYSVRSKSGALPTTKLGNARLRMLAPGKIELAPSSSKKAFQFDRDKGRFTMQLNSHLRMTPDYRRTITRALSKMTLGCMYLKEPEVALSERFDPIRRMILGLDTFHGYFGVSKKAYRPTSNKGAIQLSYTFFENDRGEESVLCHFFFLGLGMFTDLEIRESQPLERLPEDFATVLEF